MIRVGRSWLTTIRIQNGGQPSSGFVFQFGDWTLCFWTTVLVSYFHGNGDIRSGGCSVKACLVTSWPRHACLLQRLPALASGEKSARCIHAVRFHLTRPEGLRSCLPRDPSHGYWALFTTKTCYRHGNLFLMGRGIRYGKASIIAACLCDCVCMCVCARICVCVRVTLVEDPSEWLFRTSVFGD